MHPVRAFAVKHSAAEPDLVRVLATARVLKAFRVERTHETARPRWMLPVLGLVVALVTAALGLHTWLHGLRPLAGDEASLATFLAVWFAACWASAAGLVSGLALLAVVCAARAGRPSEPPSTAFLTRHR